MTKLNAFCFCIIASFGVGVFAQSKAGVGDGGGGFAYSDLGIDNAARNFAEYEAKFRLPAMDQTCVNRALAAKGLNSINLEMMADIFLNARFEVGGNRRRANKSGQMEPLIMDYGTDHKGHFIVALEPFFQRFAHRMDNDGNIRDTQVIRDMMKLFYHEVSHFFGYGETDAKIFAEFFRADREDFCIKQ